MEKSHEIRYTYGNTMRNEDKMKETNIGLRNYMIYQVYIRSFSESGTFSGLIDDLERIKRLGTDIIYLLPIHPIGLKNRKGTLGSPYAISDYFAINPEFGNLEDFQRLIQRTHDLKMKVMMDVVYNHTSRDSELLKAHPEWFYKDAKNQPANRIGEWWDVVDLDYSQSQDLWTYLIDVLKYFAGLGVDGFRADVSSTIPLDFWFMARRSVEKVRKDVIWLSESVQGPFVKMMRDRGFNCHSEAEMFQAFDMAYDYDVYPEMLRYLDGQIELSDYLQCLVRQEQVYPHNYVKIKYLENHDTPRIAGRLKENHRRILNWTAFMTFQKGAMFVYNGQEYSSTRQLSLFEKESITQERDISDWIAILAKLKHRKVFAEGEFTPEIIASDGLVITYENKAEKIMGFFQLGEKPEAISCSLPDGAYRNRLGQEKVAVKGGKIDYQDLPCVFLFSKPGGKHHHLIHAGAKR